MPRKITEEDYRVAMEIMTKDMKVLDPHENDILPSRELSAEQAIIKQEAFNRLSSEAKEVVLFILNQPTEVLKFMATPKMNLITRRSVFRHLSKVFHSRFIARQIIKEITEWVNRL